MWEPNISQAAMLLQSVLDYKTRVLRTIRIGKQNLEIRERIYQTSLGATANQLLAFQLCKSQSSRVVKGPKGPNILYMMLQPKDSVKAFVNYYQQLYREESCPGKMERTKNLKSINVNKFQLQWKRLKKHFEIKTTNLQSGLPPWRILENIWNAVNITFI